MTEEFSASEKDAIFQALRNLDRRIARLELRLDLLPSDAASLPAELSPPPSMPAASDEDAGLELSIGEFGLAWAGSAVFLLGIVFLMTYAFNQGYHLLSTLIGYCAAAGFYVVARIWPGDFPYLSRIVSGASLLLAYYATLRLHYFAAAPLVENERVALVLLFLMVAVQLILALAARSQVLAGVAILLCIASGLLSGAPHLLLSLVTLQAALAVFLALRWGWWRVLNLTILLSYGAHLIWLLNDPLAGHSMQAVSQFQYHPIYLFLCAAIFSVPPLLYDHDAQTDAARVAAVILNCLGFSAVVSLAALALYRVSFAPIFGAAFLLLLAGSIAQWLRTHVQFAPTAYACFSYMALSVAIYGNTGVPDAFLWLALQSFLVVSMALWFRSRTLVFVNTAIYLGILGTYWFTSPQSNLVNFVFALVALASARVMNWKKERLTLRTEGLRNVYLTITFVLVLYSLVHAIPESYVALSWTVTAVGYFLISLLLKNVKYRWMALFTMMATVLYLFVVDLARLDPRFRVAAFLFLGLMAVSISVFYTRFRRLMGGAKR
jgi:hypothetical protein